jgi:glutamate synthase domain-containing protein 3
MAPKGWANEAEKTLLYNLIPTFVNYQAQKRLSTFWDIAEEKFFAISPVQEKLFPGRTADKLNAEELDTMKEVMALKKNVHHVYQCT